MDRPLYQCPGEGALVTLLHRKADSPQSSSRSPLCC